MFRQNIWFFDGGGHITTLNNDKKITTPLNLNDYIFYNYKVSRLTNKKKYPSVCTCFYGETIKSNFEKIYNQLKELLDKKEQDYNISPDVIKGNNEFREKLSCVQFNIPLLSKEHIFSLKDNRLTITLFNSKEDTKKSIEFYKRAS